MDLSTGCHLVLPRGRIGAGLLMSRRDVATTDQKGQVLDCHFGTVRRPPAPTGRELDTGPRRPVSELHKNRQVCAGACTGTVRQWVTVSTPSIDDIEFAFYERFFFAKDIEPYPVQEQALNRIFAGDSVMVTVPTGTGKTLIAKAAIYKALEQGQRAVYTTPLRALTEEKYRELCDDFGYENVGFATGDFKINRDAPIQVEVAEILWNRIFGDKSVRPADVVIMDEGHYFNDFSRGYVWEQSIIGIHPTVQLIVLSATVGHPDRFCHWVELTRRIPMILVESRVRRVPLTHEFREDYLIDVVRDLNNTGDIPAIIFVFGREKCFEAARLLKSCRRFTSDEERARIEAACDQVLWPSGVSGELRPLLAHGIGVHHAGILPRYKQMVEELALERLLKFVVSTETIAAGINLPAKTVVFPSLRKYVRKQTRLVTAAEFHQMAGRAGRPQFDTHGLAIAIAPEEVVQEIRKEIKTAKKKGYRIDEEKVRKSAYSRVRSEAQRRGDVLWDPNEHKKLVEGEPAALQSKTQVTAEQVLAIGLPDLTTTELPGAEDARTARAAKERARIRAEAEAAKVTVEGKKAEKPQSSARSPFAQLAGLMQGQAKAGSAESDSGPAVVPEPSSRPAAASEVAAPPAVAPVPPVVAAPPVVTATPAVPAAPAVASQAVSTSSNGPLPVYMKLDIVSVVDNLLLSDRRRREAHRMLAQVTDNLRAVGVIDAHGNQIAGQMIGQLQGLDGMFIYYVLMNHQLDYEDCRELIEYMIDHNTIQRILDRKEYEAQRTWIRERLREVRRENPHVTWDDIQAEYQREFPRELNRVELIHQTFAAVVPHPELHGGKIYKNVWARMEDEDLFFMDFVEHHHLEHEEGSLFSYLIRVMNFARALHEVTHIAQFDSIRRTVRNRLAVVDERMIDADAWHERWYW